MEIKFTISFGRCLGVSNRLLQSLHMNVLIGLLRRRLASTVRSSIKTLVSQIIHCTSRNLNHLNTSYIFKVI